MIRSFRNDLYAGYKTEAGMPPELLAQFPIAEQAIEALGLVSWAMVEYEADDAIGAAAELYGADPRVERIVICTPDKDMAQCVRDERIVLWDRRRDIVYDDAGVRAKWGVAPESVPDRLALVGDAADGYPGAPRLGRQVGVGGARAVPALRDHPGQRRASGTSPGCATRSGSRRRSGTTWPTRCCTATSRACARSRTACRSPSATSTSSSGGAPSARRGRRSATSGAWRGCGAGPHRWR